MKLNKKKIACFALASALIVPGAIGLAGCEKGHTHAFTSDPFYEVVLDGETKIARSWRECSCGAEDAHKKVENAVIATPSTAQDVIDQNINGKVVVFAKDDNGNGTYSTTLDFRPSSETATVYNRPSGETWAKNEVITDWSTLKTTYAYIYERNWENITFTAVEGVEFTSMIALSATIVNVDFSEQLNRTNYDDIKNLTVGETAGYYAWMNFNNITFTRINFNGGYGRIHIRGTNPNSSMSNITVKNCTFNTDEIVNAQTSGAGIYASISGGYDGISNLVVKNNNITGHYQGVALWCINGAEIINNNISNSTHNAIAVQSNSETRSFTGDILIKNNQISNGTDRAIRFGYGTDANITIINNTINNTHEADKTEVLKTNTLTDCTFVFENNTYDGVALEDVLHEEKQNLSEVVVSFAGNE